MLRKIVSGTMLISLCLTMMINVVMAQCTTGVKQDDWIKYNATGTYEGAPIQNGWAKITIQYVAGATVSGLFEAANVPDISGSEQFTYNVETDAYSGMDMRFAFIPANMNPGSTSPGKGALQGPTTRCGRDALSLSSGSATFHWDRATGVLLEAHWQDSDLDITLKASETNMWSVGFLGLDWTLWIIIIVVIAAVAFGAAVLVMRRRKTMAAPPTSAQAPVPPPPPPPPPP